MNTYEITEETFTTNHGFEKLIDQIQTNIGHKPTMLDLHDELDMPIMTLATKLSSVPNYTLYIDLNTRNRYGDTT